MRVGCLQFAPQVGDIDNNLNRADAVLAKANQDDLNSLDLLVLPELAFTGYNFKSLEEISPYLEPSGSGISSLWARTVALKFNTHVVISYPERVDVSPQWPTGPEYYSSAIVVNGDGETIANYRKSFLFPLDETWALEGKHGFFGRHIPGLGRTALGISMDINPYRFEAPWHAFEFAFHILEVRANLVIVSMAWLTREDCKHFTRMPDEPDMETLTYWVQRLEPVIRAENSQEVIVVFCNRTGIEGDAVYAGTSAVIGIQSGIVSVYRIASRNSKELLVVDTDDPPYAKLVQREDSPLPDSQDYFPKSREYETGSNKTDVKSSLCKEAGEKESQEYHPTELPPRTDSGSSNNKQSRSPRDASDRKRKQKPSKIEIPDQRHGRTTSIPRKTPVAPSPDIPTPTAPSPTPQSARPKLIIPGTRPTADHIDTPYPASEYPSSKGRRILGGHVSITTHEDDPDTLDDAYLPSERYFWMPSSTLLHSPLDPPKFPLPDMPLPPESPTVSAALIRGPSRSSHKAGSTIHRNPSPKSERSEQSSSQSGRSGSSVRSKRSERSQKRREVEKVPPTRPAITTGVAPARPASPETRNARRSGRYERRGSEVEEQDIDVMTERLEALRRRTQSATSQSQHNNGQPMQERPRSPKSRNASRPGRPSDMDLSWTERALDISRDFIPTGASDSVLANNVHRPQSNILAKDQNLSNSHAARSASRNHQNSRSDPDRPSSRTEGVLQRLETPNAHIEPSESRTMLWSEISKIVGEHMKRPDSREADRGRQRSNSVTSTQARHGSRGAPIERAVPVQARQGNGAGIRSVRYPSQGPPVNPDDEIVAEIIFRRPACPTHNSPSNSTENASTPSQSSVSSKRNSSRQSRHSEPTMGQQKASSSNVKDVKTKTVSGKEKESKHNSIPTWLPAPPQSSPPQNSGEDPNHTSPPDLSGSSIHTLNSIKSSPTTPSAHSFEPSTPKAMILSPEYSSFLSTASDPLSNLGIESLNALLKGEIAAKLERPRSSIW